MEIDADLEVLRQLVDAATRRHTAAEQLATEHERLAGAATGAPARVRHRIAALRSRRTAERHRRHLVLVRQRLELVEPRPGD